MVKSYSSDSDENCPKDVLNMNGGNEPTMKSNDIFILGKFDTTGVSIFSSRYMLLSTEYSLDVSL